MVRASAECGTEARVLHLSLSFLVCRALDNALLNIALKQRYADAVGGGGFALEERPPRVGARRGPPSRATAEWATSRLALSTGALPRRTPPEATSCATSTVRRFVLRSRAAGDTDADARAAADIS